MADTAIAPGVGTVRLIGYPPLVVQSSTVADVTPIATFLRSLFPNQRVPVTDKPMGNEWYRYLSENLNAQTDQIEDIQTALELVRTNSARIDALVEALNAMAVQNAAAIKQTITVVQAATLPGAETIPPVQSDIEVNGGGGD